MGRLVAFIFLCLWLCIAWQFFKGVFPTVAGTVERAGEKVLRRADDWSKRP